MASKRNVRIFLDRRFPSVARAYRSVRDRRYYASQRASDTGLGFTLIGGAGQAETRRASGEADRFRRLASQVDAVIDIGANVGFFACIAALLERPVLAIEPHPGNVSQLCQNVRGNHLANVEVFPVAVSEAVGIEALFGSMEGASLTQGWAGIGSGKPAVLVPVTTLDNLAAGRFLGQRLLIKLDVEGNEYRTMLGASSMLSRTPRPIWLVEHGLTENFGDVNPSFRELFDLFWTADYRSFADDEEGREVKEGDVQRWLAKGERDFGSIGFRFVHRSAEDGDIAE